MTLVKRLFTSVVLIVSSTAILFFANEFFFSLQVIIFTGFALYEFLTLLKKEKIVVYRVFGMAMGLIIPTLVYMELGATSSGEILFLVLGCLFLFILKFFHDTARSLVGIALTLLGILYIS